MKSATSVCCRPDWVIDATFDLFVELGATDEQCDFPVVYASGANGIAGSDPKDLAEDLAPLFEAIVQEVAAPSVDLDAALQMLVTNLDYDEHKGRIAIGRVTGGRLDRGGVVGIAKPGQCSPPFCAASKSLKIKKGLKLLTP